MKLYLQLFPLFLLPIAVIAQEQQPGRVATTSASTQSVELTVEVIEAKKARLEKELSNSQISPDDSSSLDHGLYGHSMIRLISPWRNNQLEYRSRDLRFEFEHSRRY